MSSNKGKDGELTVLIILSNIGRNKDGVDVTRPTTTNTADQGADMFLTHPSGFLTELANVAGVRSPLNPTSTSKKDITISEKSRIDVKTTDRKLQKDTVEKFIDDINMHPKCVGHLLIGGEDLTGPARKTFEDAQSKYCISGKTLLYIPKEGIKKIEEHYKDPIKMKLNKDDVDK